MKKSRTFTFSLKNEDQNNRITKLLDDEFKSVRYAYIKHDKDCDKETGEIVPVHYHYYIEYEGPRSITTISNYLDIPDYMVQIVHDKVGILRYLTHIDNPEKAQYSLDDINCNFDIEYVIKTGEKVDVIAEYRDFCRMKKGEITREEFLTSYNIPCGKMTFSQRIRIYTDIGVD